MMKFLAVFCLFIVIVTSATEQTGDRVVARTGSRLQLSCPGNQHLQREPRPLPLFVTWQCTGCHGNDPVTLARFDRDRSVRVLVDRGRISLDRHSFQLTIEPLLARDSGQYRCIVNNHPTPESVVVIAQDVPGAPGRPLVTGFTSRSANISWAPSSNSRVTPILHYIVQIKEGEKGAWGVRPAVPTITNRTSFSVSGLKPYTVYSFRVLGVNALGQGAPGSPSYFMVTHRELPAVRPVIVSARNLSASSVEVAWRLAPSGRMNGEFLGYHLTYRPLTVPTTPPLSPGNNHSDDKWISAELPAANVTKHVINDLEPYSTYRVRLQYANMLGLGPPVELDILTDEGEPGAPRQLTAPIRGDTWAQLQWRTPEPAGANIVSYFVYFETIGSADPLTDVRVVNASGNTEVVFNLTGLAPFSEYRAWTRSKSRHLQSEKSEAIDFRTDVAGPSAPLVDNVTCLDDHSLFLQWQRPMQVRGALDFYLVEFRDESMSADDAEAMYQKLVIPSSIGRQQESMFVPNLTINTVYEVRISAGANSIYDASRVYIGASSDPRRLLVQDGCEQLQLLSRQHGGQQLLGAGPWSFTPGVAAGLACSIAAVLLASLAYIMWKKYFQEAYNQLDEQNKTPSVLSTDWENDSLSGHAAPIPVHLFPNHVFQLNMDGGVGYSKEFENIQSQAMVDAYTSDFSQQPENKTKNRYLNIIAYDHTRVPLVLLPGQKRCEYVNANYIDGFQRPRAYIGTQGPLPDTYGSFWRMIWEQNVRIVVMITNLVERGRKKCDLYWPQEGSETYGLISVTSAGEDVMATYTIRKFKLQYTKSKKSRKVQQKIVYQYHYTHWPDHGIPENPLPLLSFVRKSSAANRDSQAPIVVHCSAGVGRTGTYIVLDSMLQMIRSRGELNIFGFLKHIRSQRNFLVQTEDQYVFIHDALLQAIECGETDIHCSLLGRYIHNLQATDQDVYPWYNLERQFKLVTCDRSTDNSVTTAHHPLNYRKNRSPELVPPDIHRVCLTPRAGVDCSDYINASWVMGFHRLQEFIITQHPLTSTVHSFWQMVWDHNVQTIVLLSPVNDQEYCIFWPLEHQDIKMEQFGVRFTGEALQGNHMIREFIVHSATDDYEMAVRIVQCSGWPTQTSALAGVFGLVRAVQHYQAGYQQGPCVVVDRYGGTEAATFCCLTSLLQQLQYEAHVDVFLYARLCHNQRLGVWRSQDDFLLIYRAIDALVSGSALAGNTSLNLSPPLSPDVSKTGRNQHAVVTSCTSPVTTRNMVPPTPLRPILKNGTVPSPATSMAVAVPYLPSVSGSYNTVHFPPSSASVTVGIPAVRLNANASSASHVGRVPPDGRESAALHVDNYVNT